MRWTFLPSITLVLALPLAALSQAEDPQPKGDGPSQGTVSFMKDLAPILVQNCIACHNPKKNESKYVMTTFAQLAKGGQMGEGITLEPGDPDASYFVELIRHDGSPRMPWKLDPLPLEQIALIETWVRQGAKYDGNDPSEDWVTLLHKTRVVNVPETYAVAMPITALAFSPDGSSIVVSGYHELTEWKREDGSLTRRVRGLAERTYDVAFSPDGRWMATASGDPGQFGKVTLWKTTPDGDAQPEKDLVEIIDVAYAVAFSPDSKRLAAAGADRAIRLWDVESAQLLFTIEDHADWILDLAFSPDGKRLASASRDKTSKVFDVEKKESLVTFPAHAETVYSVAWATDGKSIATAGGDNQVRIWNPDEEAKQIRAIGGFGGAVFQVLYQPDGKSLIACSADRTASLVDPSNGKTIKKLEGHPDWVYCVALSPDGKTLATGCWNGEVKLWDLAEGKPLTTILAAPGLKRTEAAQ
jgi:WD40 repeat protein